MKNEVELEKIRKEVYRKIGRNVVLFQRLEQMLKFIVATGKVSGSCSELAAKQEQKVKAVRKQTMGPLVGEYLEGTYSGIENLIEAPSGLKEPFIQFGFWLEYSEVDYENKKKTLASVVSERNDLIHQLLPSFNENSIKSCLEIEQFLDQQHKKILPEIEDLKNIIDSFIGGRKRIAEFLASHEGREWLMLTGLKQSRLIRLFGKFAAQVARPDGWGQLNTAYQLVRQQAPDDLVFLKKRYGHKTLKGLILASGLFEINEEPTEKGGIRVLYKLKPEHTLQYSDNKNGRRRDVLVGIFS
jgi:hypothetical protein